MSEGMKRRDVLVRTGLVVGGLMMGKSALAAHHEAEKKASFAGYNKVDAKLFEGINRVGDPAAKNMTEKKHAPVIEVGGKAKAGDPVAVTVTIGEVVHPMSSAHYIQAIELFAGNEPVGRVELGPLAVPKAVFFSSLDKSVTLVARAYCNLHGLWESRMEYTT